MAISCFVSDLSLCTDVVFFGELSTCWLTDSAHFDPHHLVHIRGFLVAVCFNFLFFSSPFFFSPLLFWCMPVKISFIWWISFFSQIWSGLYDVYNPNNNTPFGCQKNHPDYDCPHNRFWWFRMTMLFISTYFVKVIRKYLTFHHISTLKSVSQINDDTNLPYAGP